jgi:hypothetical protein
MSLLSVNRIKYLREVAEAESLDLDELSEIEQAFDKIPQEELRDVKENAMATDMLDELEERVTPLEWAIYNFVVENFGESEANDPSWDIGALANHLEGLSIEVDGESVELGEFLKGRL